MTQTNRPYVTPEGRLTRDGRSSFSTVRILISATILVALFLTNPLNGVLMALNVLPRDQAIRWNAIVRQVHQHQQSPRRTLERFPFYTNYGLFLLSKNHQSVTLHGLLHTIPLCRLDSSNDFEYELCSSLATSLCHGKPMFDWKGDLSYSTCQFVSILLLFCMLISFCAHGSPVSNLLQLKFSMPFWLQSIVSILSDGITFLDVARWNVSGYAALKSIERVNGTYIYDKHTQRVYFCIASVALLFVVGGFANYVGNQFDSTNRSRAKGMNGPLAACLGYSVAIGNRSVWFSLFGTRLTLPTFFWMEAGYLFLTQQVGSLATVLTGAAMGNGFGNYHHEFLLEQKLHSWEKAWNGFWNSRRRL